MRVSTTQPFRVVYSLFEHEYLGYLCEPYAVQVNSRGELTLLNQSISLKNCKEFSANFDEIDWELIKLLDAIQQDNILKKFNPKKYNAREFFLKVYDAQKGDKLLQEAIEGFVENHKAEVLERLTHKPLFIMGNDGNPAWQRVELMSDKAKVYFHFNRKEDSTHYFPIVKHAGERLLIRNPNTLVLCDEPAWLLCNHKLYRFDKHVDGKKLRPFLQRNHIVIPKNVEDQYYRKFVAPLIANYEVYAQGFEIRYQSDKPVPILTISEVSKTKQLATTLFGNAENNEKPTESEESEIVFDLSFQYGNRLFRFDSFAANANVSIEKNGDEYIFHKIRREVRLEKNKIQTLKDLNLDIRHGRCVLPKAAAFAWLQTQLETLENEGFSIRQNVENDKQYFLGYSSIEISIEEVNDWFDVYAIVKFGEFEIPFIKLKNLILNKKREFKLPNGQIAVIPEVWLTHYSELFAFAEYDPDEEKLILKKHHLGIVQDLSDGSLAKTVMSRRLEQLQDFQEIKEYDIPKSFKGHLRPYQKAGYDWMRFLGEYNLGGCLADDMGLGKTVQTLALLLAQKDKGVSEPSLLVMPTSLLYNWELEAQKFTPSLKVFVYTGTNRDKNKLQFDDYDLILTSYGILRIDIEYIKNYRFNYVILDESQAIKNPSSNISRAVTELNARHRLILTGTPLENSTMDLWTQMSFVNPGLLGSQSFFRSHYQTPIEKYNDAAKTQKLFGLIKPFLLRRHKAQVALDLPSKVENIHFCNMTEAQEERYEEAKSYYRNLILESIEENGVNKSQMTVLQGLTKLRQLANHPLLIDSSYEGDSGKMEEVVTKLEGALAGNHKILIFSQFVRHLDILRNYLNESAIDYAYLDGSTIDRHAQVDKFQNDDNVKIFLISLKAGGVGLNLTAADYVFLLDPWWNPAAEAQAIDRAHRIGQTKTVFTYKFITKNTVEEKIVRLQRNKQKLFNDLITAEESFVKSLSKDDIMALLD